VWPSTENAINALGQNTIRKINDLNDLETEMSQLFSQAEALDDLAKEAKGKKAKELFDRAQQARLNAEQTQTQVDELHEEVNNDFQQVYTRSNSIQANGRNT
jgi:predicted  nucleic acid-binding Zn-ribbon protein